MTLGVHGFGLGSASEANIVYVNDDQLDQVQYLLEQSASGNHILFDNDTVKRVKLTDESSLEPELKHIAEQEAEQIFEKLVTFPTLESKRTFLSRLDPKTYIDVVRVYMNIALNQTKSPIDRLH